MRSLRFQYDNYTRQNKAISEVEIAEKCSNICLTPIHNHSAMKQWLNHPNVNEIIPCNCVHLAFHVPEAENNWMIPVNFDSCNQTRIKSVFLLRLNKRSHYLTGVHKILTKSCSEINYPLFTYTPYRINGQKETGRMPRWMFTRPRV